MIINDIWFDGCVYIISYPHKTSYYDWYFTEYITIHVVCIYLWHVLTADINRRFEGPRCADPDGTSQCTYAVRYAGQAASRGGSLVPGGCKWNWESTFRDDVISHLLDLFMGNSQGFCRRQTSLFVIEININFITHLLIRHTSWHVLFSPTAMREKGGWAPLEMLGASILHQVSLDEFVGRGSGFLALVPNGCPWVVALIFTHCTRLRIAVITDSEGPRHWWTWCFWVFVKRRPL